MLTRNEQAVIFYNVFYYFIVQKPTVFFPFSEIMAR